ncbi:MAG: glycosyl hydrolase, partial [Sphingobacteriia bacterium]
DDAGESWRQVSKDHRLIQRAWYYIELFTDPQNEQTLYVLSAPMLRSKDGGKTWENMGGTHGDYHNLWINPRNPKHLVVANDGGAAVSFNGGDSWSTQNNQPTAQIYRISVDNEFPYHIYGGQQDNTSVKIPSRALGAGNIDVNHWFESAGGESAFLAFDPNNPRYVMGGSYQGTIEILDSKTLGSTKVMPSPIQYLGKDAAEMKYRYNWNAPIIRSVHEENTFYHGAQLLLRTKDMGKTWVEVSPDLTRNEKDKQGKPGIPFTNEAVGAENYGTLSYVLESPLEKGLIYTGSDDGYVYMTQNNGASWTNITPAGLGPCLVNAIEVSPFDKGTVYIATTRYKFNDHQPGLYKSTDYGKTWKPINKGIGAEDFTRVVREDQVRKGLLFAGTERGLYLSWDGGENWKPFPLNLPSVPITDLKVHQNNLIAATSGRSFWVLDDIEVLRQYQSSTAKTNKMVLHQPKPAMLMTGYSEMDQNGNPSGTNPTAGVNPATGLVLYYHLPSIPDSVELTMVIRNAKGELVHRYSSKANELFAKFNGRPGADPRLPKKPGLNRFVWNLRHETVQGIPGVYIESSFRGHKAIPGKYSITLTAGKEEQVIQTEILANPLFAVTPAEYAEYDQVLGAMEKEVSEMHQLVNDLDSKRQQLEAFIKQWPAAAPASLKEKAQSLVKALKAWDNDMIQRKSTAYDDVENFPNKFTAQYMFTMNQAESDLPRINQPVLDEWTGLRKTWAGLQQRGQALQKQALPELNAQLSAVGIGAIWKDF